MERDDVTVSARLCVAQLCRSASTHGAFAEGLGGRTHLHTVRRMLHGSTYDTIGQSWQQTTPSPFLSIH